MSSQLMIPVDSRKPTGNRSPTEGTGFGSTFSRPACPVSLVGSNGLGIRLRQAVGGREAILAGTDLQRPCRVAVLRVAAKRLNLAKPSLLVDPERLEIDSGWCGKRITSATRHR